MKNLKKVLALVVALTMVFTTVAFASYPDVDANADYAGAVELLSALDILKGDDAGNFNPDNTITRAEFAAVVCRALGLEGSANGAKGATMFTDVAADHWASGYINLASQQGIVNGKGNGIFDPEGNVTFTEAVKMLVVALGYEPMASQRGGWPTGYLTVANSTKMTAGVSASGTDAAALRSTVAQLTANAIEIPVMDQTSFGTETKYEPMDDYGNYKTLLTSRDVYIVTGVITDVDEVDGEFDFKFSAYPDDFEFGYNSNGYAVTNFVGTSKTFDVADSNVADYIGQSVDVYLNKVNKADYEAIIAVPSGIGETLTISVEDFDGVRDNDGKVSVVISDSAEKVIEYYETKDANKTTKIYVAKNPIVKVNGKVVNNGKDAAVISDLKDYTNLVATFTFTENTNDKYFDIIDITVYEYGIVEEVYTDKERIEFIDGNRVTFDSTDDEQIAAIYNAEGAEIALEDIVAGDVLAMVVGDDLVSNRVIGAKSFKDKITVYNLGQSSVTGTVTGHSSDDKELVIDGATYEYMAANWVADSVSFVNDCLGAEGIFYLGLDGKIIGFDGSSVVSGNYGFIANATLNTTGFAPHYQIKLLTADAGIVTFDVDTECEINGVEKKVVAPVTTAGNDEQAAFLALGEYVNSTDKPAADARLIKYDTNKNGEIDEIDFVAGSVVVNGECGVSTASVKVDGNKLDANVVIFDVSAADVEDAKIADLSTLIEDVKYEGFVFDVGSTNDNDIFVMTVGGAVFAGEDNLLVVDSVVKTTYDEDDAYQVNYYVAGEADLYAALFTDESNAVAGVNYDKLTKGSVFVANVAEDGFVTDYAVLATMKADKTFDTTNLQSVAAVAFSNDASLKERDGVEFVYGYVYDREKTEIKIGSRWYDVTNAAAQYAYNTNGSKAKIEVGLWDTTNVDEYLDGKATLVLIKLFDGDVTDIISITDRKTVSDTVAKTVISETNASAPVAPAPGDDTTGDDTTGDDTTGDDTTGDDTTGDDTTGDDTTGDDTTGDDTTGDDTTGDDTTGDTGADA